MRPRCVSRRRRRLDGDGTLTILSRSSSDSVAHTPNYRYVMIASEFEPDPLVIQGRPKFSVQG